MNRSALLLLLFVAGEALAQVVVGEPVLAPPSLIERWLTPAGLASVIGFVVATVGAIVWFTNKRKRIFGLACYHAFHIVEDVGNELDGEDAFDKTARYLKEVDALLLAQGWRPMKPGDIPVAKALAQSMHGEQVAQAKVLEAAITAAAGEEVKAALGTVYSASAPTPPARPSSLLP